MLESLSGKSLPFRELWVVCLTPLYMSAGIMYHTGKDIHVYTHTYIRLYENIYKDIREHKYI